MVAALMRKAQWRAQVIQSEIKEKPMNKSNQSATSLKIFINHVISNLEVTPAEYRDIIDLAHNDGVIDKEEKTLLSQFQLIISNGAIKRVRD